MLRTELKVGAMAEIINLRMARKAKSRREASDRAAENRARFGQTKATKQVKRAEAERLDRNLDGAKLDDGIDPSDA